MNRAEVTLLSVTAAVAAVLIVAVAAATSGAC